MRIAVVGWVAWLPSDNGYYVNRNTQPPYNPSPVLALVACLSISARYSSTDLRDLLRVSNRMSGDD